MNTKTSSLKFPRVVLATFIAVAVTASSWANHPVLVEGNNVSNGAPGTTVVPPGTGGDSDGDGLVGTAEDTDNAADRIFGTITTALSAINGGANQNGRVTIVSSGRFNESITITAANGNVTIEAAPGVEGNIDAVVAGSAGNDVRQRGSGIVINAPDTRVVTLRNLTIRNFATGIEINGASRVHIDNCRLENNRDHGIKVTGTASVSVTNSQVNGTGHRVGALGDTTVADPPAPGNGITFESTGEGLIVDTIITGSFGTGLVASPKNVTRKDVLYFDNAKDFTPK